MHRALVHLDLPAHPASPRAPGCRRGTDRSLTIAVEELEPVVNPVIGLFAVGFLGCGRTQRHNKRRRKEVCVSEWTHFEATFPKTGRPAGKWMGPGAAEIAANCDPSAALPTLTAPSSLPENSVGPGGSSLGQQRQELRVVARSRAGSSPAPFTLECEAGLASLQLWSPTRTFLEQNLMDEEPGFAQDGKWLGGPRSGVC